MMGFLVFTFVLYIRQHRYFPTKYLIGILVTWSMAILSLVLYLGQHSFYLTIANQVFYIGQDLWNLLLRTKVNLDTAILLLNLSVIFFVYFLFASALSMTQGPKKRSALSLAVLALLLIQAVYYNPYVFRKLYWPIYKAFPQDGSYNMLLRTLSFVENAFHAVDAILIFSSLFLMIRYYIQYPKIRIMKRYLLLYLLSMHSVVLVFYLILSWAPIRVLKPTAYQNFFTYITPPLESKLLLFNLFPYLSFVFYLLLFYCLYKFKMLESMETLENTIHLKNIDTANFGARMFSHTIKNQLLAIRTEAEEIKERMDPDDSTSIQGAENIIRYCNDAFANINRVHDRLRRVNLQMKRLSLQEFFAQLNQTLPVNRDRPSLNIIPPEKDVFVYIDSYYLTDVIRNLIDNAVDAIGENREDGKILLYAYSDSQWAFISVQDNGCGMKDDIIANVFTPFFTTKGGIGNWGVGLTYCQAIVTSHFGKIAVESTPGKQTVFRICLPVSATIKPSDIQKDRLKKRSLGSIENG